MTKAETGFKQPGTRVINPEHTETAKPNTIPLNFKVPVNFQREFKVYAAQHNKKLNQLLYEAFAALKAKND